MLSLTLALASYQKVYHRLHPFSVFALTVTILAWFGIVGRTSMGYLSLNQDQGMVEFALG